MATIDITPTLELTAMNFTSIGDELAAYHLIFALSTHAASSGVGHFSTS
jgi:hypothetical protein